MSPRRQLCLAAIGLGAALASAASGARAECTSENSIVLVPKNFTVQEVAYRQVQDAPVRATLWSNRLGPRNIDSSKEALPKDAWTPVTFQNPAQFSLDHSRDWKLGVAAMSSEDGEFNRAFDCVEQELHANGSEPYGYYVLNFIPRVSDPGKVGFQVRVQLHKGPIPVPRPQKEAKLKAQISAPAEKLHK
jgi:hypothetical protein